MSNSIITSTVKDLLNPIFNWDFIAANPGFKDFNKDVIGYSVQTLKKLLYTLKEDLIVVIESSYIDKVFRDSYYHYFASKLLNVSRDCIRVSFINPAIGNIDISNLTLRGHPQMSVAG